MRILDQFPHGDALKCVLKDGTQISMLDGLQGVIAGMQAAAALDVQVSLILKAGAHLMQSLQCYSASIAA